MDYLRARRVHCWDSRNTTRRGHRLLALLALVPYAVGIFLLACGDEPII